MLDSFRKLKNDVRSTVSQYIQSEVDYLKTEQISFLHRYSIGDGFFIKYRMIIFIRKSCIKFKNLNSRIAIIRTLEIVHILQ